MFRSVAKRIFQPWTAPQSAVASGRSARPSSSSRAMLSRVGSTGLLAPSPLWLAPLPPTAAAASLHGGSGIRLVLTQQSLIIKASTKTPHASIRSAGLHRRRVVAPLLAVVARRGGAAARREPRGAVMRLALTRGARPRARRARRRRGTRSGPGPPRRRGPAGATAPPRGPRGAHRSAAAASRAKERVFLTVRFSERPTPRTC